jgi:hypothetical protein
MRLQPSDGTCLLSAKLSANQPAQWHTLAILHTLQMPHSPVFLRRGSALTRKIAFQNGELIFLRNWAYVYRLAEKTDGSSKVAGKFGVAPLPGLNGPGVSTLGGHKLAIGTYAADFIK